MALALTGIIGTALVITLTVLAARFIGGAVDYLQSMDMTALQSQLSEAELKLGQHQQEIIEPLLDKLKSDRLSLPQREEIGRTIMETLKPEQRKQIEALKNIESGWLDEMMASWMLKLKELGVPTGLPETIFQKNLNVTPSKSDHVRQDVKIHLSGN
ncbi:MAG: hypothetical protein CVU60_01275 [Deltaproteobacteria bacterium HGW-Deltaproteobacteria-18]|jgi:hypothetical protein|nr:MAG: hypothetical protein CVU60_01275 [Deltaproteobacteria bacterium HGW-Deltaproteobacteria-18]